MTELAMLLHWTPQVMHDMELGELMQWRARAVELHNAMNAVAQS